MKGIVWFRTDLRIDDNPAFLSAHQSMRRSRRNLYFFTDTMGNS